MPQIKNSFDPVTKKKIITSLWLSLISASGAFISSYAETKDAKASAFIALATAGGFLANILREYVKGQDV